MRKVKNIKITDKKPNKPVSQHLIDLSLPIEKQKRKRIKLPKIRLKHFIKQLSVIWQIVNWKRIKKIVLLVIFFLVLVILIACPFYNQTKKVNQQITTSSQQIIQYGKEMMVNISQFNFEQLNDNLEQTKKSLAQMQQQLATSKEYRIVKYLPYGWGIKHFLIGSQSLIQAGQSAEQLVNVLLVPVEFPQLNGFLSNQQPIDKDEDEIDLPNKLEQINFLATSHRFNQRLQ